MNTPCWEAGGWTGLTRGDATELLGTSRVNDIAGKAARVQRASGRRATFKTIYAIARKPSRNLLAPDMQFVAVVSWFTDWHVKYAASEW